MLPTEFVAQVQQKLLSALGNLRSELMNRPEYIEQLKAYQNSVERNVVAHINQRQNAVLNSYIAELQTSINAELLKHSPTALVKGERVIAYPQNTRFFFRNNDHITVIIEEPPAVRSIYFDEYWDGFKGGTYNLAFPYTAFIIVFRYLGKDKAGDDLWSFIRIYCVVSKTPLVDNKVQVYGMPLPNLRDYHVCMGTNYAPGKGTIANQCNDIIGTFWASPFHKDEWRHNCLTSTCFWPPPTWQAHSESDPLFPCDNTSPLQSLGTLSQVLEQCVADVTALASGSPVQSAVEKFQFYGLSALLTELQNQVKFTDIISTCQGIVNYFCNPVLTTLTNQLLADAQYEDVKVRDKEKAISGMAYARWVAAGSKEEITVQQWKDAEYEYSALQAKKEKLKKTKGDAK